MPLFRAGSARSTLSVMQRRTTKYQKFLNLSNVFLLITSTILIFSAAILIKFYHVAKLDFWSVYFWLVPTIMIVLGVYTFLTTVYGFLISGSENRALLAVYAVLLGLAFLVQLVSIFTALELRTTISQYNLGTSAVNDDLSKYNVSDSVTAKWDSLQKDMSCCGGNNYNLGYTDYRNTPFAKNYSGVPDSCCHPQGPGQEGYQEGCGRGIFDKQPEQIRNIIFVDGCVHLLRTKLQDDVLPMMIMYACVGVLLAIVELITVVLACAYIAQISRKRSREDKMWRHGTADHDGGGGEPTVDAPLNHDTMV